MAFSRTAPTGSSRRETDAVMGMDARHSASTRYHVEVPVHVSRHPDHLLLSCLVLSCLVLSCLVLSCLVLSCLVLSCLVLSCLVLSCLVLSCLVLSCLVLSCLVLSCLVLSCLVLSCLVLFHKSRADTWLPHCTEQWNHEVVV